MKKKEKETEKEKTKFLHSCAFRHFQAGPSCWACDREKKNEKRKEGEDIQGDQLHATGSSMLVVSLCIEEGGWPCIEIVGGTWVGDAHNVGAGGLCHCQDLEMVWLLWLLAKREWGRVKTMFRCVLRGCANAQDWEKRKEKKKKKKQKKKEKGKKKNAHLLEAYTSASWHWQFDASGLFVGRGAWSVACQPQAVCRSCGGTCR